MRSLKNCAGTFFISAFAWARSAFAGIIEELEQAEAGEGSPPEQPSASDLLRREPEASQARRRFLAFIGLTVAAVYATAAAVVLVRYLQGWSYVHKRTPQDFVSAVTHFKRALELDPDYEKNGWTPEKLAIYFKERKESQSNAVLYRRVGKPKRTKGWHNAHQWRR